MSITFINSVEMMFGISCSESWSWCTCIFSKMSIWKMWLESTESVKSKSMWWWKVILMRAKFQQWKSVVMCVIGVNESNTWIWSTTRRNSLVLSSRTKTIWSCCWTKICTRTLQSSPLCLIVSLIILQQSLVITASIRKTILKWKTLKVVSKGSSSMR